MAPSPELDRAVLEALHREADEHRAAAGLALTEYVVIASTSGWNDQGQEVSQVVIMPSGSQHRIAGLLREATVRIDAEMLSNYMEPDD
jgi:hypothetical protein